MWHPTQLAKIHGLAFDAVEAFNEPIATWWKADGTQEGCHFDASTQATLLPLLRAALDRVGLLGAYCRQCGENASHFSVPQLCCRDLGRRHEDCSVRRVVSTCACLSCKCVSRSVFTQTDRHGDIDVACAASHCAGQDRHCAGVRARAWASSELIRLDERVGCDALRLSRRRASCGAHVHGFDLCHKYILYLYLYLYTDWQRCSV